MTPAAYKEIGLAATSVLLAIVLFASFAWAVGSAGWNVVVITVVAALAALWLIVSAITFFVARQWSTPVVIVVGAAAATMSAGRLSWGSLGGGLLLLLFAAGAWQTVRRDSTNIRVYKTNRIFTGATKFLVMGLVVAAAGIALSSLEDTISRQGIAISSAQVDFVLKPLQPLLASFVPGLGTATNVDSIIDGQLREQGVDPATVDPAQREQIHQQLSDQLNVDVTGKESLGDVVTGRLNETLQRLTQTNALTIALVAVVLAFLTLRAFVPAISWLLVGGIALAVWLARRVGLVVTVKQTIETEVLTL